MPTPQETIVFFIDVGGIILAWWWLWLPIILFKPAINAWLWWKMEQFDASERRVLLEMKVPADIEKPFFAMENVFVTLWQATHDPPDKLEPWLEGKFQLSIALEMVSLEGEIHFYLRVPQKMRKNVESAIYSQFPDLEFREVEDYTKKVPPDIPNKEWTLWGTNYQFKKPNIYPLKTYSRFFEPRSEAEEESKIDPMSVLLEGLQKIGKGEQIWIQMVLTPITPEDDYDYVTEGRSEIERIASQRVSGVTGGSKKGGSDITDDLRNAASLLVTGQPAGGAQSGEEQKESRGYTELTPGEKEVMLAIEQKISRYAFSAHIRFIYLARREKYFSPTKAIPMSYFTQFSTQNLNGLRPLRPTLTKTNTLWTRFLDARRTYVKRRRIFRNYQRRVSPFFPRGGGTVLLNTEELATLFHFPGKFTAPTAPFERITARRGGAPPQLPSESE